MKELPYRQIHMDFHTSPYITPVGDAFNKEEFVQTLKEARVNSINLFAKCHHGMYYYPTAIGTMHPGLNFDLLGQQMQACREHDIRTCIYTCVGWNEDWADRHPEWLLVSPDGQSEQAKQTKPFSADYYTWQTLCLNNREYREHMKLEFNEIHQRYKPEGYWIDIVFQKGCICKSCMRDMKEAGLDPQNNDHVVRFSRLAEISYMKEIYGFLMEIDQGLSVIFNGLAFEMDLVDDTEASALAKRAFNTSIDIESLPSDVWGYTHFPILVNYLNKDQNKELTMMNGKFHMAWGDFGSLRNKEALEYECFRALANGAKICVGDQLHPSGQIDKTVYNRIGNVFKAVEPKETWCYNSKKISQIGVFASNMVLDEVSPSSEGVYRMLSELHHTFDFIDYGTSVDKYDLLILPDQVLLKKETAEKIQRYLSCGGKVILTGESGLDIGRQNFALETFGVEYVSGAQFHPRYLHIDREVFTDIEPMDYVMYEEGITVKALESAEVMAAITNPYFNRTYDRFCSHRQTPPGSVTDEPGIVRNGNVIYVSNPLFKDYAINGSQVYKQIIRRCIEILMDKPLIRTDLPTTAEVTLRCQGESMILHILHYIIQKKCRTMDIIEEKIPLYGRNVELYSNEKPKRVYLAPQMDALDFDWDGEYCSIEIPEINGHQMVVLEMGQ